jgi:alkylhydroperoxidase/carboxymuconolactone decarboxylase family protein YurZ
MCALPACYCMLPCCFLSCSDETFTAFYTCVASSMHCVRWKRKGALHRNHQELVSLYWLASSHHKHSHVNPSLPLHIQQNMVCI